MVVFMVGGETQQNLFGIQLLLFKFSTVAQTILLMMRKRSGAFHSDSEEGYAKLAELGEGHSALFYDEIQPSKERRKRKYAMSLDIQKQQAGVSEDRQPKDQARPNPFASFDFDQQTDNFLKDYNQLAENQRKRSQATLKTHIVILCTQQCWKVGQFLRQKLGATCEMECPDSFNVIDLCVNHSYLPNPDAYYIDCFWIINKSHLSSSNLLPVYLRTCTHLWDITQMQSSPHPACTETLQPTSCHCLVKFLQILYEGRAIEHAANS